MLQCRSPISLPVQPGSLQRPEGLVLDQCRASLSVLYLPDNILATITAFLTSKGLCAEVYRGCGGSERHVGALE